MNRPNTDQDSYVGGPRWEAPGLVALMSAHNPEEAEGGALLGALMKGVLQSLYLMRNDHIADAALSEAAAELCKGEQITLALGFKGINRKVVIPIRVGHSV
eukprot:4028674-Pyramimonas_sp.AAC.1